MLTCSEIRSMSATKFNTIETLRHLQQARGHAVFRTLHAQLLHNSRKQLAFDSSFCFNVDSKNVNFGCLKQRQNSGNNRITSDGYFLLVDKQLHPALAENRLPLCGVPRARASSDLIKCNFALCKRFRQDDVRTHPFLSPIIPNVTHEATK